MLQNDRRPLSNTPTTARISANNDNRFGAVLSALQGFWSSRDYGRPPNTARRDAYSVVLFDHEVEARFTLLCATMDLLLMLFGVDGLFQ